MLQTVRYATLGSVALLLAGCSPADGPNAEVVRPVKTIVVTSGENTNTRTFPGTVEAASRVQLAFQVSGLLIEFPVLEGQRVAKGDVIGRVREDEYRARLTALQGQLEEAQAALRALLAGDRPEERLRREADIRAAESRLSYARADAQRQRQLMQRRAGAQSELDRAETAYRVAQEALTSARKILELGMTAREEDVDAKQAAIRGLEGRVVEAQLQLEDCTLRAPYDGTIAERFVELNQNVRAKEPVVKFQDTDEVELLVDVPEVVMSANLRSADIIQLFAEFPGAPGLQFPVRVTEIGQRADPTTQTFQIRAAMRQPDDLQVLPGMSGTVTITYRRAEVLGERTMVPIEAVAINSNGEAGAWVVSDENKVESRPIKLGEVLGGQAQVVEGLAPGDRIVIAGLRFLREGMIVRDLANALGDRS
jgi:membrane fusion protein, multidrug efflux system